MNKYQTSLNNVHVIVLALPHSTVIECTICIFTWIAKLLKILIFAHEAILKDIKKINNNNNNKYLFAKLPPCGPRKYNKQRNKHNTSKLLTN